MSKTFYLFRHGLATKSTTGYGDQILTAELLPEGIPAVQRIATFLKDIPSEKNFASEIKRCRQTVAIIQEISGKNFVFDSRLNEYNAESFESFDEFSARVKSFVDELQSTSEETSPAENIVICTHGAVIAALKNFLTNGSFHQHQELEFPLTGELMVIRDKNVQVRSFN